MRHLFREFYEPDPDEMKRLWKEAGIVLDANVLLHFFECEHEERESLFALCEKVQDRLWIAHFTGLEYQRNRAGVTKKRLDGLNKTLAGFLEGNAFLGLRKHLPDRTYKHLNEAVSQAWKDLGDQQRSIAERLDALFKDNVGAAFTEQGLAGLAAEGKTRFDAKIPPGYADRTSKSGKEFHWKEMKIESEYGDYYFWSQVLHEFSSNRRRPLILVQKDSTKGDWFKDGMPRPELVAEAKKKGIPGFWMFAVDDFLKSAAHNLDGFKPAAQESGDLDDMLIKALTLSLRDVGSVDISTPGERLKRLESIIGPGTWGWKRKPKDASVEFLREVKTDKGHDYPGDAYDEFNLR